MAFSIVAELPLGTYRARGRDGRPERIPSVARLHSALLCAAGFGPRAVPGPNEEWQPCPDDDAALRWLEVNPPDRVSIPALEANSVPAIAFRDDGTFHKLRINRSAKTATTAVAVGGHFVWTWRQPPPLPVREAIAALCGDVPYLGTTESPARLRVVDGTEIATTHELATDADLFAVGATIVERPQPGRVDELTAAFQADRAIPSREADKVKTDEKSLSPVPRARQVAIAQYLPAAQAVADVPWPQAVVLPVDQAVPADLRVRWAVAVHRALIALIGDGAPQVITGAYPRDAKRPVNRVALHFLGADAPIDGGVLGRSTGALVVLVPRDISAPDAQVLFRALSQLRRVTGPNRGLLTVDGSARVLRGDEFWRSPQPGMQRHWRTDPAAVPDTRGTGEQQWTFADAALLSVGFVWKAMLPRVAGRHAVYQEGMVTAVAGRGAAVLHASPLRTREVGRYVHRINPDAVIRPYDAELSLGDLAGPGTVLAIGQSRHLGGGLLVPCDVPRSSS